MLIARSRSHQFDLARHARANAVGSRRPRGNAPRRRARRLALARVRRPRGPRADHRARGVARYSRLGGRNRFDVDAVVDAAEKLPDAHDLAPPAAVARRPDRQGHDKPVEPDRTARGGSEGEPEAKLELRSANFVNIQVPTPMAAGSTLQFRTPDGKLMQVVAPTFMPAGAQLRVPLPDQQPPPLERAAIEARETHRENPAPPVAAAAVASASSAPPSETALTGEQTFTLSVIVIGSIALMVSVLARRLLALGRAPRRHHLRVTAVALLLALNGSLIAVDGRRASCGCASSPTPCSRTSRCSPPRPSRTPRAVARGDRAASPRSRPACATVRARQPRARLATARASSAPRALGATALSLMRARGSSPAATARELPEHTEAETTLATLGASSSSSSPHPEAPPRARARSVSRGRSRASLSVAARRLRRQGRRAGNCVGSSVRVEPRLTRSSRARLSRHVAGPHLAQGHAAERRAWRSLRGRLNQDRGGARGVAAARPCAAGPCSSSPPTREDGSMIECTGMSDAALAHELKQTVHQSGRIITVEPLGRPARSGARARPDGRGTVNAAARNAETAAHASELAT